MLYDIEMRKVAFTAHGIKRLLPRPHIHSHLELVYLTKGQSIVTLDNRQYILNAGDIFLSFPNQLHFYNDQTPVEGFLVIHSPETLPEFSKIFKNQIPTVPIWHAASIPMDVSECFRHITAKLKENTLVSAATAKGYLLSLIGELFSVTEWSEKPGDYETVKKLLYYCMENYTRPLTLDLIAKELYLNKYYISHIFTERMNISYKDFITQLRMDHACKLLKSGETVTDTAYASGFSSTKTFNRVFLKYMQMSPREYVKWNVIRNKKDATP